MLFLGISHAASHVHTITKHIPHRPGASDGPHDAPRPVQHANLRHVTQTDPLATVSVLPDAAPHAYKCAAAQSMLRDRRAAATAAAPVHRITVVAR